MRISDWSSDVCSSDLWWRFIGRSLTAAKTARTPTGVDTMKQASLLGIALVLAAGNALAQDGMTEAQVRAKLETQGYTKGNEVKLEDGVWKADARSGDGNRVDVRIDPETGVVRPDELVANLSEADVHAKLSVAGYTNVHDVDYEDGIWNAAATGRASCRERVCQYV